MSNLRTKITSIFLVLVKRPQIFFNISDQRLVSLAIMGADLREFYTIEYKYDSHSCERVESCINAPTLWISYDSISS